jgi:hypothetical protein
MQNDVHMVLQHEPKVSTFALQTNRNNLPIKIIQKWQQENYILRLCNSM